MRMSTFNFKLHKLETGEISKCRNLKMQKSQDAEISEYRNLKMQKSRMQKSQMQKSQNAEIAFNGNEHLARGILQKLPYVS